MASADESRMNAKDHPMTPPTPEAGKAAAVTADEAARVLQRIVDNPNASIGGDMRAEALAALRSLRQQQAQPAVPVSDPPASLSGLPKYLRERADELESFDTSIADASASRAILRGWASTIETLAGTKDGTPNECPKCGLEEWDYVYEAGRVSPSYKHCCRCDTQWSAQ